MMERSDIPERTASKFEGIETEFLIIGGGPAGLSAAASASRAGVKVLLVDENPRIGGQLNKQTHTFFGSCENYAGARGIDIPKRIIGSFNKENVTLMLSTSAFGIFDDNVAGVVHEDRTVKHIRPKKILVSTGASENMLPFENNDLPGVYGAGAVQTLMNLYGVKPGQKVLMVGAGNVGLIVSYQLMQAGVNVVAVVEAASKVGGYRVHADKLRRLGVPILLSHTIKKAIGTKCVKCAEICKVDEKFNPIAGTEKKLKVDVVCLAVGLSPLIELLWQRGCEIAFIRELGGFVPVYSERLETTVDGIYVAGDAGGIDEASTAMLEGRLAGLEVARSLGYKINECDVEFLKNQLAKLRAGPFGEGRCRGKCRATEAWNAIKMR